MSEYKIELEWLPEDETLYKRMAKVSGSPEDEIPEIVVVTPPEFKKGIPNHWSPEHLFVASLASCFFTTFLSMADTSNLPLLSFKLHATGTLDKDENGNSQITAIEVFPEIEVASENDQDKAEKLVGKVEANCLISNSMKSTVTVTPTISVSG
jgi:organic hydroperoxide reductase OsmC/OhrA